MLEFYLDTADVDAVARFNSCLPIRGVTTNPSILAKAGIGISRILPELASILAGDARFFVQVVSQTVDGMVEEARNIAALPYDLVVKVPATETGLTAIKLIKAENIQVLATAIYTTHQGFLAALSGADYLAPYVNRIDVMGADGIKVVADLQLLINQYGLKTKLLPASFKNSAQVVEVLKLGVAAITLPVDVTAQLLAHPAVQPAVDQFDVDWHCAFGNLLSFES
ncbi:MAG: fructose-6-phosphate aldolase [Methylomicrobium sp.]|nr:fructose-6-phosphate aldolase [Methylomicrobium sp.]